MKKKFQILITFILTLIFVNYSYAECSMYGLQIYPSNKTLSQNSLIILNGYFESQELIDSLNTKYPIYLETVNHRVELVVIEYNQGMYSLSQAVLRPKEKLINGKEYFLKIDNLTGNNKSILSDFNFETGDFDYVSWIISDDINNNNIPQWLIEPFLSELEYIQYGCGPSVNALFEFEIKEKTKTFIKAKLIDLTTNETNSFYLSSNDGTLRVGHNMCNGAFSYEKDHKYKVKFSLMDLSGNSDYTWSKWTYFNSPLNEKF